MKMLKVKAKDNHGYSYDVAVINWSDRDANPILRIMGTPGSWYFSTLRNRAFPERTSISLDWGQNWDCINFDEILAAVTAELNVNL